MLVPRFRWVIKNDDLALADAILDGVRAAASAGFFATVQVSAPAQWGAAVALFAAVFKVVRNALRKGVVLDARTYSIVTIVKKSGPLTGEELLVHVQKIHANETAESVRPALEALKAMPMRDGTVRALVAQDGAGRWVAAGI